MISSGVLISFKIKGVKQTPKIEIRAPAIKPKAKSVCIAFLIPSMFFIPKFLEIITPAPIATPLMKLTSIKIRGPEEETEAKALGPKVLPTIRESTVL